MKKLVGGIFLFLVTALTYNTVFAGATYYISTTGNDTTGNGSYATPWATTTKAFTVLTGDDWMIWKYGLYTSTGHAAGATVTITAGTLTSHSSHPIVFSGELPQGPMGSTWCVILQGGGPQIDLFGASYLAFQDFYTNDTDKAVQAFDCPNAKISFKRIGFKNPARYVSQYGQGIDIGDDGNSPFVSSSDFLFEDCWLVGDARYLMIWGGSPGFAEHIIGRRIVTRNDGNNGVNPKAGLANYGATGSIDGARNNIVQNGLALDYNNSSFFQGGEDVYGAWYCPWAPTNIQFYGTIAMNMGDGWRGFALGEGSAAQNAMYDCVAWRTAKLGIRITGSSNSSMTATGCTLVYSTDSTDGEGYDTPAGLLNITNSIVERNRTTSGGAGTDDFNAYESTANPATSTNEILGVHQILYIASVTASQLIGTGKNGANVGAVIIKQRGKSGTFWGEPGYNALQTDNLWPYPYEDRIKSVFQYKDTGDAKTNNSTNNTLRGFASSTQTLTSYVWTAAGAACPAEICTAQASGGGGAAGTPEPPTVLNLNGNLRFQGGSFTIKTQ